MLDGRRILLGVTGGIAAYKSVQLLRDFQKAGAEVRVVMTPAARKFVGIETFRSLTGGFAASQIFTDSETTEASWVRHVHWAEWADLGVIAPCTANTLSKIVHGQSDNLLTAMVLAFRGPLLVCPTMDGHMYEAPPTRKNLERLQQMGYYLMEPEQGYLASGLEGKGRLPETDRILERAETILADTNHEANSPKTENFLQDKHVVVTAGPTREHLDPVRFISNPSSGKMGVSMAEAAHQAGADVTLIHGPLNISPSPGIHTISVTSAQQMYEAVLDQADQADIFILAAAVSDFTPTSPSDKKRKKNGKGITLQLNPTPDTLQWLGSHKKDGQMVIGFAMESENLIENAKAKRERKKADWIIANSIAEPGSGFASDENRVVLIGQNHEERFEGEKKVIAHQVLRYIFQQVATDS